LGFLGAQRLGAGQAHERAEAAAVELQRAVVVRGGGCEAPLAEFGVPQLDLGGGPLGLGYRRGWAGGSCRFGAGGRRVVLGIQFDDLFGLERVGDRSRGDASGRGSGDLGLGGVFDERLEGCASREPGGGVVGQVLAQFLRALRGLLLGEGCQHRAGGQLWPREGAAAGTLDHGFALGRAGVGSLRGMRVVGVEDQRHRVEVGGEGAAALHVVVAIAELDQRACKLGTQLGGGL
jgi:hypothetical protein